MRIGVRVAVKLAKEHVIRPLLALVQRVIAGWFRASADDETRRERVDRIFQVCGGAGDMHAIGFGAAGYLRTVRNQRRCAGCLDDRHAFFAQGLKVPVGGIGLIQDDGRHIAARERILEH